MNLTRLLPLIIGLVVIFLAFRINWLLGVAVIIGLIGYGAWSARATFLANKAHEASARGDVKRALELIEQAARLNRKQPAIMASRAYLLLKDGRIGEAEEALAAVRNMPGAGRLKLNVTITQALIRWKQGRLDEAVGMLEELHGQMQNTLLYGSLGYLYVEQGDLDKTLAYNLEACDFNDTDGVILDNLLTTRILRGEWAEARETAEKLMNLNPRFPEAFYHNALVKDHFGELESALEHCEWALDRPFTAVSTVTPETIIAKRDELAARLGRASGSPDAAGEAEDAAKADAEADTNGEAEARAAGKAEASAESGNG